MSVKTTKEITRKQAIEIIIKKRLELMKKEMELSMNYLTNKALEQLLDEIYYENEFENYSIYE